MTTDTLCLYAQFLSRSFKSSHSIKNYLSGVKTMHHLLGYSTDHINEFLLNLGLRGIARSHPHLVRQAEPITPEILLKMYVYFDMKNPTDTVYWCLFLFAFFLFARKSNLVPDSIKDLKNNKILLRRDVQNLDNILIVTMKWSKTIQFGQRVLKTPLIEIPLSALCPVSVFKQMCKLVKAKDSDPLFTLPSGKCITYSLFQSKLRYLIEKIGLKASDYSSHSFRRGGASYAFRSKVPADLIKIQGDWKSDCYQQYLSFSLEDKLLVAAKMRKNILSLK